MPKLLRRLIPLLPMAFFALALWALFRQLGPGSYRALVATMEALPGRALAAAGLLTLAGYAVHTGYDWVGSRFAGLQLPFRKVALAAFVASAFGHTVGHTFLTPVPLRARLYGAWGATVEQVTKLLGFGWVTAWLGFLAVAGGALASGLAAGLARPVGALGRGIGILLLLVLAGYLVAAARGRSALRVSSWNVGVPALELALGQVVLAAVEW